MTHWSSTESSVYHFQGVDHETYIDCDHNTEQYVNVSTLALCIYRQYAPHVRAPPDTRATLDGDYRWAVLKFCTGRCEPDKQGPEATLELWDRLEDHTERAQIRFIVYLASNIIDGRTGRVLTMQPAWGPVLKNLKLYVRTAMWEQVRQWARHDNQDIKVLPELPDDWREIWTPLREQIAAGKWDGIDRLPRWCNLYQADRHIYQGRDGDFGLCDKMRIWSCGNDLPKDARTGRLLEIRPRGLQGYLVPARSS